MNTKDFFETIGVQILEKVADYRTRIRVSNELMEIAKSLGYYWPEKEH